jgi:hypothetical protein
MQPPRWRRRRETSSWWTLSRSPAQRSTSHASNTRFSSECPASAALVSASVSSGDWLINSYAPIKWATAERVDVGAGPPALGRALGLATTVTESDGRYPQTVATEARCRLIAGLSSLGVHEHRSTTTVGNRTAGQTEERHERSSRESPSSLLGSGGNGSTQLE